MRRLLATATLAMALAPAEGLAADISGVWKVHGVFAGVISYTAVCTFKQSGSSLGGPCVDPANNTNVAAKGSVSGNQVEFSYQAAFNGTSIHLDYKGVRQSDGTLKGTVDTGGPQGTFTANR